MSNKIDFQPKYTKEMKKDSSYSSMKKIYQDQVLIVNVYVPNAKAPTFIKEIYLNVLAGFVCQLDKL
jgi:predicted CoA-binding protein